MRLWYFMWLPAVAWLMPVARHGPASGPILVPEEEKPLILECAKTDDFELTGDGRAAPWEAAPWLPLPHRAGPHPDYRTDLKMLYSASGLYFLFRCGDGRLTASLDSDFSDLWKEDVVEVFLWPDERDPLYFEYELSPLDRELPLLIPNLDGQFWGWRPWHYEGERLVRHATAAQGGTKAGGSAVQSWTAEIFIPHALLKPMRNVPPSPGTRWRANFYRCDYDSGPMAHWAWRPIDAHFHEPRNFGTVAFR